MPEEKTAIINVSKGLLDVSLATLGAVAGATGNAPVAGMVAIVQTALGSRILKPFLEKKQEEHLELPIPPSWTGEPQLQSWQAVCSRIENRLPVILTGVQQHLSEESRRQKVNYLSTDAIKRLFIEQIVQQLTWEVNSQDRYLVADYIAPLLLEKTASALKMPLDATRQDAIAQWMSQVADQLNAIQQAHVSLVASNSMTTATNTIVGAVSQVQPMPVDVKLAQKQQSKQYDVYISYNQADITEVMDIAQKIKAQGLLPWLDVQEVRPGKEKIRLQEEQMQTIPVAAIFVGQHKIKGEQELETHSFIKQFIKRDIPVIPVILLGAPEDPELPPFLSNFLEVNFHRPIPEPMGQLIWGITGERP